MRQNNLKEVITEEEPQMEHGGQVSTKRKYNRQQEKMDIRRKLEDLPLDDI